MNLREFVTIQNLNTSATKTIDDEGNIEDVEGADAPFDFFDDGDADQSHALRADGSHDGLDDLDAIPDPFADDAEGEVAPEGEQLDTDELPGDEELDGEGDGELGLGEEPTEEDPDFQGVVRTVTGACLVYKRKNEEGTYEELWIYNIGKNMRNEVKIRRSILAGTDIPAQDVSSPDGTQTVENTTIGNVQYLRIMGLPN